jgi:glycerophosphoryl diester phosphodiesterase
VAFFDGAGPLVIAHRGLAIGVPENTLPAFRAGLAAGADIVETDVHLSKDGQVIVAHDANLDRVAGVPGHLRDHTAKDLAGIDLGGGVGFPTLVDLLEALPQAKINIDLKTLSVVPAFVDVIRQLDAHDRILVTSFDEVTRIQAVRQLPGVVTSASRAHFLPGLLASTLGRKKWLSKVFANVDAVQAPRAQYGVQIASRRFINNLTSIGKEFHVWTINDPTEMRKLLALGVTGIVTDRTDLAVRVRAEHLAGEDTP